MSDFWQMGGYAIYVWPSYALFLFVLVYWLAAPWLAHRQTLRKLAQQKRRMKSRNPSSGEQHESQA